MWYANANHLFDGCRDPRFGDLSCLSGGAFHGWVMLGRASPVGKFYALDDWLASVWLGSNFVATSPFLFFIFF